MTKAMTRILAVDPGFTLGWAVVERKDLSRFSTDGSEVIDYCEVSESSIDRPLYLRLHSLAVSIVKVLQQYQPEVILLEDLNISFDREHKNRQALQKYSAAWGVIYTTLLHYQSTKKVLAKKEIQIEIVPLPRPNPRGRSGGHKKIIIAYVNKTLDIKQKSSHVCEAIYWAMQYERKECE